MGQEQIWEHFQNDQPEIFVESGVRLAWCLAPFRRGQRVLDIGVGGGVLEGIAQDRGIEIWAVDPSERSIASLRERLGLGERAQVAYADKLPFPDGTFDGVVLSEVLEHLDQTIVEATLREVRRVLVPGGQLVGTTPSDEDLAQSLVVCPECGNTFHRWGHVQSFDDLRLRRLLTEAGLVVDRCAPRLFVSWSRRRWTSRALSAAKLLLHVFGRHSADENLCFVAHRP